MQRPGQTLLEVMIAITIILVGLISVMSWIISTTSLSRLTYQEAIAVQLGREAIEAARFIRDSNWLERESGNIISYATGLQSGTEDPPDYTGIYIWQPGQGDPPEQIDPGQAIAFDFTPDAISEAAAMVYLQTGTHYYLQTSGPVPDDWQPSPYKRFVAFYPICSSNAGITEQLIASDGKNCAGEYPGTVEIGRQVIVQVQWNNSGEPQTRTIEERIYNWQYPDGP